MGLFNDSKQLLSLAGAEGKVVKLRKLIALDLGSLDRPDGFLNRHAKIESGLTKLYAELEEAEQALHDTVNRIG